jgi:hypothetical protein
MNKFLFLIIIGTALLIGVRFFLLKDVSVVQSHRNYEIEIIQKPTGDQISLNTPQTIRYRIKNNKNEIVKNFTIAHEKLMHVIVVRKDLTRFQHLHPTFDIETGEFTINVIFTTNGPYRFFADFTPRQDNPQKLPVTAYEDIHVGDVTTYKAEAVSVDSRNTDSMNDYFITYLFPDTQDLQSQKEITYSLLIEKDGRPVDNLENYLGAKGHSVILKEGTLDYIHTHAIAAGAQQNKEGHSAEHGAIQQQANTQGNAINFETTLPEPGIYKIFTQFQHEGNVYTSEYVAEVKN